MPENRRRDRSVSGLEGVALGEAISGLEAFSAANAVKVEADDFDAIVGVVSSMNPVSLKWGSSPVLVDCTTHSVTSTLGGSFDIFAEQRVTFEVAPEGFEVGDTAPFVFAVPPGPQNIELTRSVVEGTFADEAIARTSRRSCSAVCR